MNIEKIEREPKAKEKEAVLSPGDYERTDQELKDQPEYKHLMNLCSNMGIKI